MWDGGLTQVATYIYAMIVTGSNHTRHQMTMMFFTWAMSEPPIVGRGSVVLKLSSGKFLELRDVLHVPKIRKNLVSCSMLNRYGYKQVYGFGIYVLSKGGVFAGFNY